MTPPIDNSNNTLLVLSDNDNKLINKQNDQQQIYKKNINSISSKDERSQEANLDYEMPPNNLFNAQNKENTQ